MRMIAALLALAMLVGCGESRQGLTAEQRDGCAKMLSLAHERREVMRLHVENLEDIIALERSLGKSTNTPKARAAIAAARRSQALFDQGIADLEAALVADAPGALDRAFENIEKASEVNLALEPAAGDSAASR
jgi:hypothetical protein